LVKKTTKAYDYQRIEYRAVKINHPHDSFMRNTLANLEAAKDLLQA